MADRRGVVTAGTWCVDYNKSIADWPAEDTTNEVLAIDRQGGGSGCNMAIDLKRLDPALPVETMGVVGDDDDGRFLFAQCDAFGVERKGLFQLPGGATMSVDAFNTLSTGRRTHFFHQGVAALMSPEHFDFSRSRARILHLGLPGAHMRMDAPWRGEANGWVATLRAARQRGPRHQSRVDDDWAREGRGAGAAVPAAISIRSSSTISRSARSPTWRRAIRAARIRSAIARAVEATLSLGAMRLVVAHFPEGAIAATREGGRFALGSVAMPSAAIAGANGAGDAFAAGMLYGLHEDWPLEDSLRLAHACAAASMRAVSTTAGVAPVAECLALAEKWGLRPAPA